MDRQALIDALGCVNITPRYKFFTHPDNFDRVRAMIAAIERPRPIGGLPFAVTMATDVEPNRYLPRFHKRWVPPSGRFWEMEPADEEWAAKLGFGHYEDDTSQPYILKMDMRAAREIDRLWRNPLFLFS